MATKYLDNTGLAYFCGKIKSWVTSRGYITSSGSITGNAATATKLGTSTVGSSVQPVYLELGTATVVKSALKTCYGGVESEAVANTFFKIASGAMSGSYNHLKVQILVQHITGKDSCIWDVWLSTGSTAGVYSQGHSILFNSTGYYGANLIVAYKSNSGGSLDFELYVKETGRYSNHRFTVIQECWRNSQKVGDILTLYNQLTTTGTSTITSGYTALTTTTGTTIHNQTSNTINAMTGYSKPSSTSAIAATDSLNTAIGKLEKEDEYLHDEFLLVKGTADNCYAATTAHQLLIEDLQDALDTMLKTKIYPVGSTFFSLTDSRNPSVILGFGTWAKIEGRFLLGASSSYAAGSTGGEAAHTLTASELPDPTTYLAVQYVWSGNEVASGDWRFVVGRYGTVQWSQIGKIKSTSTTIGQAHNNMPPYLAGHLWRRTA